MMRRLLLSLKAFFQRFRRTQKVLAHAVSAPHQAAAPIGVSEKWQRFEMSIGPVQAWVGQARRTRDLWAGSYVLAWLSARAAAAALVQDRERSESLLECSPPGVSLKSIEQKSTDAILWGEIQHQLGKERGPLPLVASMPNHFRVLVPPGSSLDVEKCVQAAYSGWWSLCDAVYLCFVKPVAQTPEERAHLDALWYRQTGSLPNLKAKDRRPVFWEVLWTVDEASRPGALSDSAMDRRKIWRDHVNPVMADGEASCSLMPNWAALYLPNHNRNSKDFWERLQEMLSLAVYDKLSKPTLDLRPGERLCAIALVKRLFPVLPAIDLQKVFGCLPEGVKVSGSADADRQCRAILANWPSTAYLAAAPWIKYAWELDKGACITFQEAHSPSKNISKLKSEVPSLQKVFASAEIKGKGWSSFAGLDGGLFQPRSLERASAEEGAKEAFRVLSGAIEGKGGVKRPSTYYALLKMDVDQAGKALGTEGLREFLPTVLTEFSRAAPAIVARNMGVTIYAGGDDLLAIMPVDTSITAAVELEAVWRTLFHRCREEKKQLGPQNLCTVSAGLVFADYQVPLSRVRAEADRVLDELAKESNNRNSIAISLLRRGGQGGQWVSAWRSVPARLPGVPHVQEPLLPVMTLLDLARLFQSDPAATKRFFYKVRERLGMLLHGERCLVDQKTLHALFVAEFIEDNLDGDRIQEVARQMAGLLFIAQPNAQPLAERNFIPGDAQQGSDRVNIEVFWIVRFLAMNLLPVSGAVKAEMENV